MSKEAIVDKFESLRSGAARQKAIGLSILALAGGAIAGCGSNEANVEATPPPLTKTEFVEKANELCHQTVTEGVELDEAIYQQTDSNDFPDQESYETALSVAANETYIPLFQEFHDDLSGLASYMKEDRVALDHMLLSLQAAIDDTKMDPYGVLFDTSAGIGEEVGPYTEYASMVESYGLHDNCKLVERDKTVTIESDT